MKNSKKCLHALDNCDIVNMSDYILGVIQMSSGTEIVKRFIRNIGFAPQDGKSGIYCKHYYSHDNYTIYVDFNSEKIIYDSVENSAQSNIKVWEKTTSNFSQAENFVVLECVDSLLERGYAPACIELEKTYPSGHGRSGRLDILVKSVDGVPFLMVECKTWGVEFEKERGKMLKNGGQLFTYYTNDRAAKFLCLYTSRIDDTRDCQCAIIDVDPAWTNLSGVKEIYAHWNKNFKDNGIFDSFATPYDVRHRALTYGKLTTLKEEHSGKIYNQIMEILRHNAISDKPNAFNKLLNLFVCKIIDESDKNQEDELDFQWLESDTDESLQLRLNDLYKKGMWRFLEIAVIDYEQQEVAAKLANIDDDVTRQWIMKMYTDTRLKKSPNFAFVEVQDDRTFALNAKVVREIVELLQVYRFRYEQKHEFLGNFFELLLNTSMKQEAGQFFTPVPITRFIISSLPLEELVQDRVTRRCEEPLPTVIDYACGSGHFLTEYMSQIQEIIDNKIDIAHTSPRIRGLFQSWQGYTKFVWAKDSVYGIDLDNRLVKTAKVSAFFNGDGEANIIWANGLDSFTKSKAFRGKLVGAQGKDNGKFDILISNPPYSVDAFKSTIEYGEESFVLYSGLTDNSSEIECLFVERMKQLLKVGGWAVVILPSSILTNSGIHAKARTILLRYFKIKAIVEAGANTFMKTNTSTDILFLERRGNDEYLSICHAINRFFNVYKDVSVLGIENAFSTFVLNAYEGLAFEDYISLFTGEPTEAARGHVLYKDYIKTFGKDYCGKAIEVEKEKLLYFLLTYDQTIVLVRTGKGKEEKRFLGYEFSERRGHEGLHWLPGGTKLYDESDPLNPQKASSYIYHAFLGTQTEIAETMKKHIFYERMSDFMEYGTSEFDKRINLGKSAVSQSRMFSHVMIDTVPLGNVAKVQGGKRLPVGEKFSDTITDYPYLRVSDFKGLSIDTSNLQYISAMQHEIIKKYTISSTDMYLSIAGTIGLVGIVPETLNGAHLTENAARITPNPELNQHYLMYVMNSGFVQRQIQNAVVGLGTPKLSLKRIKELQIPLPPIKVQQTIVEELRQAEDEEQLLLSGQEVQRTMIMHILNQVDKTKKDLLGKIAQCNPPKDEVSDDTLISFVEMASVSNDGYIVNAVDRTMGDVKKGSYTYFRENDIIVAKITPCMENGKCALATGLTNGIGMGSSEFHVFRCGDKVLPKYLFAFLNRQEIRQAAEKMMTGSSGHKRVPITFYQQLSVPLPSLVEQRQIVERISRCEEEIANLKAQLDGIRIKKEAILEKYL